MRLDASDALPFLAIGVLKARPTPFEIKEGVDEAKLLETSEAFQKNFVSASGWRHSNICNTRSSSPSAGSTTSIARSKRKLRR